MMEPEAAKSKAARPPLAPADADGLPPAKLARPASALAHSGKDGEDSDGEDVNDPNAETAWAVSRCL